MVQTDGPNRRMKSSRWRQCWICTIVLNHGGGSEVEGWFAKIRKKFITFYGSYIELCVARLDRRRRRRQGCRIGCRSETGSPKDSHEDKARSTSSKAKRVLEPAVTESDPVIVLVR